MMFELATLGGYPFEVRVWCVCVLFGVLSRVTLGRLCEDRIALASLPPSSLPRAAPQLRRPTAPRHIAPDTPRHLTPDIWHLTRPT